MITATTDRIAELRMAASSAAAMGDKRHADYCEALARAMEQGHSLDITDADYTAIMLRSC